MLSLLTLWFLFFADADIEALSSSMSSNHLVVLVHGLGGAPTDLEYLATKLRGHSCLVLQSKVNEGLRSFEGVENGGRALATEIKEHIEQHGSSSTPLQYISVVGNSLGGIYARYAVKLLCDESDGEEIASLKPLNFVTIATPHLGVREHTYLRVPYFLKSMIISLFQQTGSDLYLNGMDGNNDVSTSLLYQMATDASYLRPLARFHRRRIYANADRDFMVPLGTAAFLSTSNENSLMQLVDTKTSGVVKVLNSEECASENGPGARTTAGKDSSQGDALDIMIRHLDSLGWEKVIVSFPGWLPFSHNKICALQKNVWPSSLFAELFDFNEGAWLMDQAAEWIASTKPS
jgi:hypothetical protein